VLVVQPEPAVLRKRNTRSPALNGKDCADLAMTVPFIAPVPGAVSGVPTVSFSLEVPPGKSITLKTGGVAHVAVLRLDTCRLVTCPALLGMKGMLIWVLDGVEPNVLGPAPSGNSWLCTVAVDTKTPPLPDPAGPAAPEVDRTGAENLQKPAVAWSGTTMTKGMPLPGGMFPPQLFSAPYWFVEFAANALQHTPEFWVPPVPLPPPGVFWANARDGESSAQNSTSFLRETIGENLSLLDWS
jgi:hypothetical protein